MSEEGRGLVLFEICVTRRVLRRLDSVFLTIDVSRFAFRPADLPSGKMGFLDINLLLATGKADHPVLL